MESTINREEWLKSLKPGDEVANMEHSYYSRNEKHYRFYKVKNITAKGNIRLTNGVLLDSNGYYRSYKDYGSMKYEIEPITDEILEHERMREEYSDLIYEVRCLTDKINHMDLTIEELRNLKEILSNAKMKELR